MEKSRPFPDPTENDLDVEIVDLPENNNGQYHLLSWMAQRVLAGQRSVVRHAGGWRLATMLALGAFVLLILGFALSNLAMLLMPHPRPAGSGPILFPTRPAFNPYRYPNSNHPDAFYTGHQGRIEAVIWSPDSQRFASGGFDNTVQIVNITTQQKLIYRGHTDEVMDIAWSPNGKEIASASRDTTVRIWDATTGQTSVIIRDSKAVDSVAWSPDGR